MKINSLFLFILFLPALTPSPASAVCTDWLILAGRALHHTAGREFMQEGRAIQTQLIAKEAASDRDLAVTWLKREIRNEVKLFGTAWRENSNSDNSERAVHFILTVPGWKKLTNSDLRKILSIDALIRISHMNDPSPGRMINLTLISDLVQELQLTDRDFQFWQTLFPKRRLPWIQTPARQIPTEIPLTAAPEH